MPATLQYHRSSDETDTVALIRDMLALDRELYGDIGEDHLGGFEYWLERFAHCPESLSVARRPDGQLAGYFQFLPVTAGYRDVVLAGDARDGQISLAAIVPYGGSREPYHLYLCSMAVRPEYRGRSVASRLYREEVQFQRLHQAGGVRLRSLVSVVWSPCGARFFSRLGLPCVGFDSDGRPVHGRELPDGEMPEIRVPVVHPAVMAVAA